MYFFPFMMLSRSMFSLSNFSKTPRNGISVSCQGTKFYSTLNQSSHIPLLSFLWLMMRIQQDSGLFWAPGFIIAASCSNVPKRERPINACLIGMLWQENMVNICNILIVRLSHGKWHYNRHCLLIVEHSAFRILGEFQDPRRWSQNPQMLKSVMWNVLVFLCHLYTPSCIVKSCLCGLECQIQCKGGAIGPYNIKFREKWQDIKFVHDTYDFLKIILIWNWVNPHAESMQRGTACNSFSDVLTWIFIFLLTLLITLFADQAPCTLFVLYQNLKCEYRDMSCINMKMHVTVCTCVSPTAAEFYKVDSHIRFDVR